MKCAGIINSVPWTDAWEDNMDYRIDIDYISIPRERVQHKSNWHLSSGLFIGPIPCIDLGQHAGNQPMISAWLSV